MGLRCLIGHDYGDPQTERDRREQGREVVVTVREFRECSRCGHRRIISENKEVTAEPPDEPDTAAAEQVRSPDEATAEPSPADPSPGPSTEREESMSADEDDGVILEDDSEGPTRAPGEWPASDHDEPAEIEDNHEPWPDESHPAAAEPADAGPSTASPADADADPVESAADETPAATATDEAEAQSPEAPRDPAEPAPEPPDEPDHPTPQPDPSDTELVCPDCGESWPSVNASLRPGDICPECRRGYLEEQVLQ